MIQFNYQRHLSTERERFGRAKSSFSRNCCALATSDISVRNLAINPMTKTKESTPPWILRCKSLKARISFKSVFDCTEDLANLETLDFLHPGYVAFGRPLLVAVPQGEIHS